MATDSMNEAWSAMPSGHSQDLVVVKPKLDELALNLKENVVGIMRVTQAGGTFALVATTARLILMTRRGSTQVLPFSNLSSIIFTEAKKKRFGLDREAYLLIEGIDGKYTFVIYRDPEWVNEMGARIESAFQTAQLQM